MPSLMGNRWYHRHMAKMDLKQAVAQVKSAYVISEYIRNSGVKLTASGPGKWKGLCPFHGEKTPSFTVSDHFSNYHCFGCGASGDLIKYAQETEHLEFMEVIKKLAEDKGIELEFSRDDNDSIDYRSLRECLKESANFFAREYRKLAPEHRARKQVIERGLSEKAMIYGYAPERRKALYEHLKAKGFSDLIMQQAGVVTHWENTDSYSDFWSGRLMFVITDITGKPIGFSGRKIFEEDSRGKYVNSQAGPLFDKSSALFNVQNAKTPAAAEKEVYIAEGQFDVAAFIEAGVPQVVASSGTAFTAQQGGILQRLVGEKGNLIFAFDGDAAGTKAALSVFKNVPSIHSNSWVIQFPEGTDPCDYRLANGNESFRELLFKRTPLVEFVLETAKKDYDMNSELGRAHYLEYAASILKTIASNTVRELFIRKVALDALVEVNIVREQVSSSAPMELPTGGESAQQSDPASHGEKLELQDSTDVLELIRERKTYALAARFLALAILEPELIQYLPKNKSRLPKEFSTVIDELVALEPGAPIIPEAFTDSKLVKNLSNSQVYPLAHLELFNAREQFEYIYKQYVLALKHNEQLDVQGKIIAVLSEASDDQVALLTQALELEQRLLREHSVGS